MAVAELKLLGPFALRLSDGQTVDLPGQKERALLAILALSGGAPQARDKLAGLLWGDRAEAQARDSLKHALMRIRQSTGQALAGALVADRQSVRLEPAGLSTDVAQFESLMNDGTPEAVERASALWSGDLLDGIRVPDAGFEEWLGAERHRLRRLHEDGLIGLLAPALPAVTRERAARRLLALDPLREAASRALMQIHAERGEGAQAVQLFERLRERLHAELGVKPEAQTVELYDAIRQGRTAHAPAPSATSHAEPPLPAKPSIAILPFQNLSEDPSQEYFADAMVEEIITALSRVRWLFVIARNSSFTYKGRSVDVKQIGRELGVRYVLEGSVRKAMNKVRITGQLIDAMTGTQLWADRFDGTLEDVFDLQDELAAKVASAIAPKVEEAEIERARRKPTDNLDAYDYYLRGLPFATLTTRDANSEALRLFHKAIGLDEGFAAAHGMAAWCYMVRKVNGWMADGDDEIKEATQLARRATTLGRDDAIALCWGGFALAYVAGDLEDGAAFIDQAIALNPNLAAAWDYSGWLQIILGRPEVAIERLDHARRLNPFDRTLFHIHAGLAWAHFFAGRYDEACRWVRGALRDQPNYLGTLRIAAASFALAGRLDDARLVVERMQELDPTLRLSNLQRRLPPLRPADFNLYQEGLRQAGLPD